MPVVKDVEACLRGYHLIPAKAIVDWLPQKPLAGYLCEAEGRGEFDKSGDKTAFAQARLLNIVGLLDEKSMRLAAADMAERVLPIFDKVLPNDKRPAQAIQAARDYANGKTGAAAGAAAWDATGQRTFLVFGAPYSMGTAEEVVAKHRWLHDLPSQRQHPTAYCLKGDVS